MIKPGERVEKREPSYTTAWCSHYGKGYGNSLGCLLVAQLVKNPPALQETLVRFLGQEDPPEKG